MKFMKLGTRPDTFYSADTSVRTIASEIPTDIAIQVDETVFLLHKFPLFSKCSHLKRVHHEIPQSGDLPLNLPDFPGGADAFELCAKFCYGVTITVSALNIVPARCAAEYLGMSDDDGDFGGGNGGNLAGKLDAFFLSCVLRRWKDTLVALQGTRRLTLWSEELGFTQRCVDAAAAAVVAYPSRISWGQHQAFSSSVSSASSQKAKGWWAEDMAELGLDHFWRLMVAVKTSGRVPGRVIGDALQIYARRWLARSMSSRHHGKTCGEEAEGSQSGAALMKQKRVMLERIVSLLPAEKGSTSCGFLLRLLRAANLLGASSTTKKELMRRAGLQMDEVTVEDLLRIPSTTVDGPNYDVDAAMTILEEFLLQGQHSPPAMSPAADQQPPHARGRAAAVTGNHTADEQGIRHRRSRSAEDAAGLAESGGQDYSRWNSHRRSYSSSSSTHGAKLRVAKLVDAYLLEVARDPKMPLGKLVSLAEMVPEFARADHDDLYRVIDAYLKSHPDLSKSERKRLCRPLDCKKLSVQACMDAAQNEKLPLRVVVQVLFFEHSHAQARSRKAARVPAQLPEKIEALLTAASSKPPPEIVMGYDDDSYSWSGATYQDSGDGRMLANGGNNVATLRMKLEEEDDEEEATSVSERGLAGGLAMMMRSSSSRFNKALCAIPSKPKRMLSRIWSVSRSASQRR